MILQINMLQYSLHICMQIQIIHENVCSTTKSLLSGRRRRKLKLKLKNPILFFKFKLYRKNKIGKCNIFFLSRGLGHWVGGFVIQVIKKHWPYHTSAHLIQHKCDYNHPKQTHSSMKGHDFMEMNSTRVVFIGQYALQHHIIAWCGCLTNSYDSLGGDTSAAASLYQIVHLALSNVEVTILF